MASPRKIAANRRNAQYSTGPRTPNGKGRVQAQCIAARPCSDATCNWCDRSRRRTFGVENRWRKSRSLSLAFCNDRRRSRAGIAPGAGRSPLVARLEDAGRFVAGRSGSGEERPSDFVAKFASAGALRAPRVVPQGSCASAAIILGSAASAWAFPHGFECFLARCLRQLAQERCFSSVVLCYYTILGCIWQNEPTKILRNQEIPKHPASIGIRIGTTQTRSPRFLQNEPNCCSRSAIEIAAPMLSDARSKPPASSSSTRMAEARACD